MKQLTLEEMAKRYAREREKRKEYYKRHRAERLAYQSAYGKRKRAEAAKLRKAAKRGS